MASSAKSIREVEDTIEHDMDDDDTDGDITNVLVNHWL